MKAHKINLVALKNELYEISEYKICFKKSLELGQLLKCYYRLNTNVEYTNSLKYSYGFISYINNLNSLQTHIKDKNMEDQNVILGTGKVNFLEVFRALKKINFTKSFTFETRRGLDPINTCKFNINFINFLYLEAFNEL